MTQAVWPMKTMRSATCALAELTSEKTVWRWASATMSERRGSAPEISDSVGATKRLKIRIACQTTAGPTGIRHHPRTEAASQAIGVEERRRLSNIFQRPEHRHMARQAEYEGQKLPVAARPAMLARHLHVVADRKVLDEFHVGRKPAARKRAFQQIVAEHLVLADAPSQHRLEGIDVIEPLAGEGAFAEKVLIDVGDREDVGIEAAVDGEYPLEGGSLLAGRQRRRHARLQDAVARCHRRRRGIDDGLVRRMRHLADELRDRIPGQPRVGIERHDIFEAVRQDAVVDAGKWCPDRPSAGG